jgi:hypothetical protein
LRWQRTKGAFIDTSKGFTPEDVKKNWDKINDFSDATFPTATTVRSVVILGSLSLGLCVIGNGASQ